MRDVRERLRNNLAYYLATKNISQKSLAKSLNVSQAAVNNWIKGKNSPDIEIIAELCEILNISINDLLELPSNKAEVGIIQKYRDLDDHGKRMVDIVIKEETSRMESERQDDVLQIPLFDLPASAGFGLPLEGDYRTIIEAPDTPLNRKADFCIRVAGDSMEPDYSDGDIVLVKKSEVYIGDIGIFVLDGESYIKELGKDVLISRNPKYNDIPLPDYDRIMVAGKVIGKL